MNKCKITVLKKTFDEELAREYGAKGLKACPMLREGQVFYADYAKPEGFCDEAWKAVYQYVFALSHGAGGGLFCGGLQRIIVSTLSSTLPSVRIAFAVFCLSFLPGVALR